MTVEIKDFILLKLPRDPRFVHSNPDEVDVFISGLKTPEYKSSGRDFKPWVPSLRYQVR